MAVLAPRQVSHAGSRKPAVPAVVGPTAQGGALLAPHLHPGASHQVQAVQVARHKVVAPTVHLRSKEEASACCQTWRWRRMVCNDCSAISRLAAMRLQCSCTPCCPPAGAPHQQVVAMHNGQGSRLARRRRRRARQRWLTPAEAAQLQEVQVVGAGAGRAAAYGLPGSRQVGQLASAGHHSAEDASCL